jgi:hypothetical protein
MEVSLVSCRGVPDDAIISVRSGAIRRQGNVSAKRPFRFPKSASESDCVVKVDIMQSIGSGYLVMRPNQKDKKQFQVVMADNQEMVCDVAVKPLEGEVSMAPEALDEAETATKTKDAKEYMESTGLLQFVQGILQVIVKQQPEDPYGAMAKHFMNGYESSGLAKSRTFSTPSSPKAESPKAASPEAGGPTITDVSQKADVGPTPGSPKAESPKAESPKAENPEADGGPTITDVSQKADVGPEPGSPKAEGGEKAVAEAGGTEAETIDAGPANEEAAKEDDVHDDVKSDHLEPLMRANTRSLEEALKDVDVDEAAAAEEKKEGEAAEESTAKVEATAEESTAKVEAAAEESTEAPKEE